MDKIKMKRSGKKGFLIILAAVFILTGLFNIGAPQTTYAAVKPDPSKPRCFQRPPSADIENGSWEVACPKNRPNSEYPDYFKAGQCYVSFKETAVWGDFDDFSCSKINRQTTPNPAEKPGKPPTIKAPSIKECNDSKNPKKCKKEFRKCNQLQGPAIENSVAQCKKDVVNRYKKPAPDAANPDGADPAAGGGGQGTEEIQCEASLISISWIICAVVEFGANFTNWFFNSFLRPLLENIPVSLDPEEGSFQAWQGFRLLANIMLVASMLAIVYAQARGDQ